MNLIFFNLLCLQCQQEARLIAPWVRSHPDLRVQAVAFMDSSRHARQAAEQLGWRFPAVGDPLGQVARSLGVRSPTVIVLLRPSGAVQGRIRLHLSMTGAGR